MKKILVTGGFGFLGTTLVERLLRDEDDVHIHIVDDLSTSPISIPDFIDNLRKSNDDSQCTFDIMTVKDFFEKMPAYYHQHPFDEIYHLAGPVGPAYVITQGGKMVRSVVHDIYLLIDYCLEYGTKLLDVSTSEVYGGGDKDGLCSEDTPKIFQPQTNMRMEYALAKLAAETAITNMCVVSDLHAVVVRPFNIAGPRQSVSGGFVVPRFVQQAVNRLPYTVFDTGEAIRAFTHVKDVADGLILAMRDGERGIAYNIGNISNRIPIKELAYAVNSVLGIDNELSFVNPKDIYGEYYAPAHDKYPDASKAINELDWNPTLSVVTIIKDYYAEYMRQLDAGILTQNIVTNGDSEL